MQEDALQGNMEGGIASQGNIVRKINRKIKLLFMALRILENNYQNQKQNKFPAKPSTRPNETACRATIDRPYIEHTVSESDI